MWWGNGSNLLVGDGGYRGVIIQIYKNLSGVTIEGQSVKAQAGALLSRVGACALQESLAGMEFACGIPGTIGGAVVMNAGAYGGEMKDILKQRHRFERKRRRRGYFGGSAADGLPDQRDKGKGICGFGGGSSSGKRRRRTESPGRMEELKRKRVEKQPLEFPSAGSTFKRPEGYFAGKLIMDAGPSGYRVGGASISEKHCGFVVNDQEATARDIRTLMEDVQRIVRERFQVELEPEVKFLGEF